MNAEQIRATKKAAEDKIAAAVREFHTATGLTPKYCFLMGQEIAPSGAVVSPGDLVVSLEVVL